jgi:hypothetical protein
MNKLKKYDNFLNENYIDEPLPEVTLDELIEKLKKLDQLCLPNGATGAVWLDDVINVIEEHYSINIE